MGFEQIKVELQEWMGSDRRIAEAAWTSSYDHIRALARTETDVDRVVRMMAEQGHGTPFESVVLRFWIRMPIFTDRQHMTHRIASHNGLSGRYRTMPEDFYELPVDVVEILKRTSLSKHPNELDTYKQACEHAYDIYKNYLICLKDAKEDSKISDKEYKRAREVLRGVLPTAGMTERTTMINLRSFANYMRHRLSTHAQPEIANVARKMLKEVKLKSIAPIALEELEKRQWLLEPTYEFPIEETI